MSDLETTQAKLRTTPTGGLSGEHSPYYRRLLSAGYKGYLQGTIGGSSFYGALGLAVGALVAVPLLFVPGVAPAAALTLIPILGGAGIIKGASTFGNIGSVAAINAESAELAEQRRYLLDRYYDLPEGPEGDRQAEIIRQELALQHAAAKPESLFHWKTVLVGAAIGGLITLGFLTIGAPLLAHAGVTSMMPEVLGTLGKLALPILITAGTAIGALAGATIGIDRHYVRRWFDVTEGLVHDKSHEQSAHIMREQQIQRLAGAAKLDDETRKVIQRGGAIHNFDEAVTAPVQPVAQPAIAPVALQSVASLDKKPETPTRQINSAQLHDRVEKLQQAIGAA